MVIKGYFTIWGLKLFTFKTKCPFLTYCILQSKRPSLPKWLEWNWSIRVMSSQHQTHHANRVCPLILMLCSSASWYGALKIVSSHVINCRTGCLPGKIVPFASCKDIRKKMCGDCMFCLTAQSKRHTSQMSWWIRNVCWHKHDWSLSSGTNCSLLTTQQSLKIQTGWGLKLMLYLQQFSMKTATNQSLSGEIF